MHALLHPRLPTLARLKARLLSRVGLAGDASGVAAVEFAMVLPVLLLLYLGTVEVSQGYGTWTKVVLTSRTSSDLIAQSSTITQNDFDNAIWNASVAVLAPYDATSLGLVVTSVVFEDVPPPLVPKAKIAWSLAKGAGASPRTTRCSTLLDTATVPAGVRLPGSSVIMSEVKLPYVPGLGSGVMSSMTLSNKTFMKPRGTVSVTYAQSNSTSYSTCNFP